MFPYMMMNYVKLLNTSCCQWMLDEIQSRLIVNSPACGRSARNALASRLEKPPPSNPIPSSTFLRASAPSFKRMGAYPKSHQGGSLYSAAVNIVTLS
jgi:hypothetical protein